MSEQSFEDKLRETAEGLAKTGALMSAYMEESGKEMRRYIWERGRSPESQNPSEKAPNSLSGLFPAQDPMPIWRMGNAIEDAFWRDLEKEFGPIPPWNEDAPNA